MTTKLPIILPRKQTTVVPAVPATVVSTSAIVDDGTVVRHQALKSLSNSQLFETANAIIKTLNKDLEKYGENLISFDLLEEEECYGVKEEYLEEGFQNEMTIDYPKIVLVYKKRDMFDGYSCLLDVLEYFWEGEGKRHKKIITESLEALKQALQISDFELGIDDDFDENAQFSIDLRKAKSPYAFQTLGKFPHDFHTRDDVECVKIDLQYNTMPDFLYRYE